MSRRVLLLPIGCAVIAGAALSIGVRHGAIARTGPAFAHGALPLFAQRSLVPARPLGAAPPTACSIATGDCVVGCAIPVARRPATPGTQLTECQRARTSRPCLLPIAGATAGVPDARACQPELSERLKRGGRGGGARPRR